MPKKTKADILRLASQGLTASQIAKQLDIALDTIEQYCCLTCGRPTEVTSKHVCKKPDPNFESRLAGMAEDEIKTALRNANFREQHARLHCQRLREQSSVKSEIAAAQQVKETAPTPRQVSDDIEHYGTTDHVATAEGDVKVKISEKEDTATEIPLEEKPKKLEGAKGDNTIGNVASGRIGTLKSQSFPVVIDTTGKVLVDPRAPYDENYRPPRPLSQLSPGMPARPSVTTLCRHQRNPQTCWQCIQETSKAPSLKDRAARLQQSLIESEVRPSINNAEKFRRSLRDRHNQQSHPQDKPFVLLAKLFKITSREVLALLNKEMDPIEIIDKIIPERIIGQKTERVMFEPIEERKKLQELDAELTTLNQQLAELGPQRQFHKRELEKAGQQDLLDDSESLLCRRREWRYNDKELRSQIGQVKLRLKNLEKILREWEKKPEHWYNKKIPGTGTKVLAEIRSHIEQITFGQLITQQGIDSFLNVDFLGPYTSQVEEGSHYRGFGYMENLLILAAIYSGIFRPANVVDVLKQVRQQSRKTWTWIKTTLFEWRHVSEKTDENDEWVEDDVASVLQAGLHIRSAGFRWTGHDFKQRKLDSFDKPGIRGGPDQPGDKWGTEIESDDYDEDSKD